MDGEQNDYGPCILEDNGLVYYEETFILHLPYTYKSLNVSLPLFETDKYITMDIDRLKMVHELRNENCN